jgi:Fe2+ or Zn2+ uptake regulation protein
VLGIVFILASKHVLKYLGDDVEFGDVKGVDAEVAVAMVAGLQQLHGFETDLSHLALQGRCAKCAQV